MAIARLDIQPLAGALGAEIFGVNLADPLDDDTFADIRQAFLDYQVIFFRDQELTPEQHKAFGRRFGTLNVHPHYKSLDGDAEILPILKEPDATNNIGGLWHSDVTFMEAPALGSILYALDVPEYGGDTMFANQYAAYEALSEGMKEMLDGLLAIHSDNNLSDPAAKAARNASRSTKLREDIESGETINEHPVVRTHPETGRKSLFVNRGFTRRFKGMTEDESAPLLSYLYQHAVKPEFTCRFRWEKGSIAFWDNRCVQHYALNDYQGQRRSMHRVTINGDRPF